MNRAKRALVALLGFAAVATIGAAQAQAIEFDFKDPKRVSAMTFFVDSTLEPIVGWAKGVSGKVEFDPAQPENMSGTIIVATKDVETTNKRMTQVLQGEDWLDAGKYDSITFAIKSVTVDSKPGKDEYELTLAGDFTCRGVTKKLNIPVHATYVAGGLAKRMGGKKGDLFILRTEFTISRKAFGIKKDTPTAVVGDEIDIRLGIVGTHMK